MNKPLPIILCALSILTVSGCHKTIDQDHFRNEIVGTWVMDDPDAPFHQHLYVFNEDLTMQQANPDAGDPTHSDSDGKGIWQPKGNKIQGKWVELTADRTTHQFTGRIEIPFEVEVHGNTLTGTRSARIYDPNNHLIKELPSAHLTGQRLTLP